MAEDVARAVGAVSGDEPVKINGKECIPRPLTVKELTELERECLRRFKKEYLSTFSENIDIFPENQQERILMEKTEEVARWDLTNLPPKWAYDSNSIILNDEISQWLKDEIGFEEEKFSEAMRGKAKQRVISTLLDDGRLTEDQYVQLTKKKPRKGKVGYAEWWLTGTMEGMISMVWKCFRDQGITRDEIASEIGQNTAMLANLSREIEGLSVPQVGNQ